MIITDALKEKVVNALFLDMSDRKSPSQAEYSKYVRNLLDVPFDKAALSQIKKPENRNVIKDTTWLKLAKHFNLLSDGAWQTAETHVYETMQTYLSNCQEFGLWRVVCDHASFGKTYTARQYAKSRKETVFYVDCSEHSTKSDFILALARQLGIERTGTYNKLWNEVTDELLLISSPLLILDEFGDVHDSIISLLKSLYNKANRGDHIALGVLHIGADNLRKKMMDGRRKQKQSYAEYWSRFSDNIMTLNFEDRDENGNAKALTPSILTAKLRLEAEKIVDKNIDASLVKFREELVEKAVSRRNLRIISEQINIKRKLQAAI